MRLPLPRRAVRPLTVALAVLALLLTAPAFAAAAALPPAWAERLRAALSDVDAQTPGDLGVHVRDLASGASVSHRAEETWYLASLVKLPVAIAVLRGVERGDYTLQTALTLRTADYVDGAGLTNHQTVGTRLSLAWLLDQMLIHSDNTASDMLVGLVGLGEVNAVAQSLAAGGLGPITSLAGVRRQVYGRLTPAALQLQGPDLLRLRRQRSDAERLAVLSGLVGTPVSHFRRASLREAYEAYYASGLNAGRLDAYADLLAQLARGQALDPAGTAYLLDTLARVETGEHRLKAGLPAFARWAHKTGTQRARVCDAGIVSVPGSERRAVVVACIRDEPSLARSEQALQAVGRAIGWSGLLGPGDDRP